MKVKQIIGVLLAVVCLLSYCSFSVFAEDATLTLSSLTTQMKREVTEGSSTVSYSYAYYDGIVTRQGQLMHWYRAQDSSYYASGGKKIVLSGGDLGLAAGHDYEFTFYTDINVSIRYSVKVLLDGNSLYEDTLVSGFKKVSVKFTAPDAIRDDSYISIIYSVGPEFNYGAGGQDVRYYISENLEFFDRTDNPSWLAKIKQWFQDLGNKIGNFFSALGDRIGGFFDDLAENIKQKFNDLKSWIDNLGNDIKQWFKKLGEDIGEFFTMLKNYLLYFQHPVTTNSEGVLIGADGKPVYTNPFENALQKVENTVYDWLGSISDFLDGIDESRENVAGYLENGTTLVNGVLKASPILSVCVTFAVAFLVIRKVVGR